VKTIEWSGSYPKCDVCSTPDSGQIDAPTVKGCWANMCSTCVELVGKNVGIGTKKDRDFVSEVLSPKERNKLAEELISTGDWDALEDLIGDGDLLDYI